MSVQEWTLQPGDLDRVRWAVHETCDISTLGVIKQAGIGGERTRTAFAVLLTRGEITNCVGHHHGDFDLCHCERGGPKLTHWYSPHD